jgi:hypothetical protein
VAALSFEGMQYRRDIGKRALMTENSYDGGHRGREGSNKVV